MMSTALIPGARPGTQEFCRYPLSARDNVTLWAGRRWTAADAIDLESTGNRSGATDVIQTNVLGPAGVSQRFGLLGCDFDVLRRISGPTVVTARFRRWRAA